MSCHLKNINPEKYGSPNRTAFDRKMMNNYSQSTYQNNYLLPRTKFDKNLQQNWCPSCKNKTPIGGQYGFVCSPRIGCHKVTQAPNKEMGVYASAQSCNISCGGGGSGPNPIGGQYGFVRSPVEPYCGANSSLTRHDPDNIWSYY